MGLSFPFALFSVVGSLAGIYGLGKVRARSVLLAMGGIVAAGNLVAIAAIHFLTAGPWGWEFLYDALAGLAGGLTVAMVVGLFLPIFEHLFSVVTDIRLLELSNQNLPLLRTLALEAPGTYQHSLMLGHLAEAAAEAIGADALLARVSGYYHDIGKTKMPDYFIENQSKGFNRHDRLEPSMSALIIAAHVKEGVEMGKKARLPEPIVTAIREHHGTKLIRYFYQKALTRHDPGPGAGAGDRVPLPGAEALDPDPRDPHDRRRRRGGLAHAARADAGQDPRDDPDDRGRLPARRAVRRLRPDDARPRDHRRRARADRHDRLPPPHRLPGLRLQPREGAPADGRPSRRPRGRGRSDARSRSRPRAAGAPPAARVRSVLSRAARAARRAAHGSLGALLRRRADADAQPALPRARTGRPTCWPFRRATRPAGFLGDIVISVPYAGREARRRAEPRAREIDRLLAPRLPAPDGLRPRDRRRPDGRARGAGAAAARHRGRRLGAAPASAASAP